MEAEVEITVEGLMCCRWSWLIRLPVNTDNNKVGRRCCATSNPPSESEFKRSNDHKLAQLL